MRRRVPAGGLLMAGLLAGLILLFSMLGRLAEGPWRGVIHPVDEATAFWVHSLTSPALDVPMWSLSWMGEARQMAVGLVALLVYLLWRRRYFSALSVTLIMPGTGVMKELTSSVVQRQRPNYWIQHDPSDLGYPGGDVMNAVVLTGLCLFLVWPRLRARWQRTSLALGALLIVSATGFSRVYVSAHWLTDNLAGVLMGAIWVAFAVRVVRWMFPHCRDIVGRATDEA
ncbi:MAG: phosphatase PAP2 family protein [Candidatus Rokuibacteriota bacterium]